MDHLRLDEVLHFCARGVDFARGARGVVEPFHGRRDLLRVPGHLHTKKGTLGYGQRSQAHAERKARLCTPVAIREWETERGRNETGGGAGSRGAGRGLGA